MRVDLLIALNKCDLSHLTLEVSELNVRDAGNLYGFLRKCLGAVLFLTCSICCLGQTSNLTTKQVKSLLTLGELWGFLKYYHPNVAQGKWDWDSVLISKIPLFLKANDKQTLSLLTKSWLLELGEVDECSTCDVNKPVSTCYNLDFTWVNEQTFSKDIISKIDYIGANRRKGLRYYVEYASPRNTVNFVHEKVYNTAAFLFPNAQYRLLLLFRYWNIVNYFSPYKYLNGRDWRKFWKKKFQHFMVRVILLNTSWNMSG